MFFLEPNYLMSRLPDSNEIADTRYRYVRIYRGQESTVWYDDITFALSGAA